MVPHPPAGETSFRLDRQGLGHLRHFARLAALRSGEWDGMGDGGLWLGVPERTLRYQLANMAYAVAAVQHNVTPAYREFGQRTLKALITKLMEPDCWKEWINVSRGGALQDPDQKALHVGSIDPLARWNIMYGGHLLQAAALYETLYAEGCYAQPGGLTLHFNERNWGFGPHAFVYDIGTLAASYAQQFADAGYEGCPCEPTLTFPECPQHAVLGLMLSDSIYGTSHAKLVCERYLDTFANCGFVDPDTGSFRFALRKTARGREFMAGPPAPWADGWTGAFMAAWAPGFIDTLYPTQRDRHLPDLLDRRRTGVPPHMADSTAGLGYFAVYAAEVGDAQATRTLLDFADRHHHPTWRDGACHYPRNDDARIDADGVLPLLSALAGNALIPFARVLPPRGLWHMHNRPWTAAERARPCITDIDDSGVGVAQALYVGAHDSIQLALEPGVAPSSTCGLTVQGLRAGETVRLRDKTAGQSTALTADARGDLALAVDARRSLALLIERQG